MGLAFPRRVTQTRTVSPDRLRLGRRLKTNLRFRDASNEGGRFLSAGCGFQFDSVVAEWGLQHIVGINAQEQYARFGFDDPLVRVVRRIRCEYFPLQRVPDRIASAVENQFARAIEFADV